MGIMKRLTIGWRLHALVTSAQLLSVLWINEHVSVLWIVLLLWAVLLWQVYEVVSVDRNGVCARLCVTLLACIPLIVMVCVTQLLYFFPDPNSWMQHHHEEISAFININAIYILVFQEGITCINGCLIILRHTYRVSNAQRWVYLKYLGSVTVCGFVFCYGSDMFFNRCLTFTSSLLEHGLKYNHTGWHLLQSTSTRLNETYLKTETLYAISNRQSHLIDWRYVRSHLTHKDVHTRYYGEDIKFQCFFSFYGYSVKHTYRYYWKHHGVKVLNTERHMTTINLADSQLPTDRNITYVFMNLVITMTDKSDYGIYECVFESISTVRFKPPFYVNKTKKVSQIRENIEKSTQSVKEIKQLDTRVSIVHLHPSDRATFHGHGFDVNDESWVSYHYTVNNVTFDESFSQFAQCSMRYKLIFLVRELLLGPSNLLRLALFSSMEYPNTMERGDMSSWPFATTTIRFCSQPRIYGWHRLSYLREFYNASSNQTQIFEFPYPHVRLILPEPQRSFLPFINDRDIYEQIEAEILAKGPSVDIDKRTLDLWYLNERNVNIYDTIFVCLLIIMCFIALKCITIVPKYYIRYIIAPMINAVAPNFYAITGERDDEQHKKYDVFICHSDEDYPFVAEQLVPRLERDLGLVVCFPDRDFHQGQDTIGLTVGAMEDSRKILIVLTDKYMSERGCFDLQVKHILLPSLYDRGRRKHTVLFLNFRQKNLPLPLRDNADVDCLSCVADTTWDTLYEWIKRGLSLSVARK